MILLILCILMRLPVGDSACCASLFDNFHLHTNFSQRGLSLSIIMTKVHARFFFDNF